MICQQIRDQVNVNREYLLTYDSLTTGYTSAAGAHVEDGREDDYAAL